MSDMADRDHIAITSGDASTTRRKFLYRDAQLLRRSLSLRVILAILIVASCEIRKYCPVFCPSVSAGTPRDLQDPLCPARPPPATEPIRLVMYHARIVI